MSRDSLGSRSGLTLLETAIYIALLSVTTAPLVSMGLAGTRATVEHDAVTRLQERNRATLFRLSREIRSAIAASVAVLNDKEMKFTLPQRFEGTSVVPGDEIIYRLELRQDRLDGTGQLVRRNLTTGADVTLCSAIELPNSSFEWNGGAVQLALSNVVFFADGSPSLRVSRVVTVFPRN